MKQMDREKKEKLIRHLKYNLEIGADYLITDEDVIEIIKALEQQPCKDEISRQAAIDAAIEAADDWDGGCNRSRAEIIAKALEQLPSVSTEKTGRWIDADGDNAICGCCNRLNHLYGTYCKHCGAKMLPQPYVPDTNDGKMGESEE